MEEKILDLYVCSWVDSPLPRYSLGGMGGSGIICLQYIMYWGGGGGAIISAPGVYEGINGIFLLDIRNRLP